MKFDKVMAHGILLAHYIKVYESVMTARNRTDWKFTATLYNSKTRKRSYARKHRIARTSFSSTSRHIHFALGSISTLGKHIAFFENWASKMLISPRDGGTVSDAQRVSAPSLLRLELIRKVLVVNLANFGSSRHSWDILLFLE